MSMASANYNDPALRYPAYKIVWQFCLGLLCTLALYKTLVSGNNTCEIARLKKIIPFSFIAYGVFDISFNLIRFRHLALKDFVHHVVMILVPCIMYVDTQNSDVNIPVQCLLGLTEFNTCCMYIALRAHASKKQRLFHVFQTLFYVTLVLFRCVNIFIVVYLSLFDCRNYAYTTLYLSMCALILMYVSPFKNKMQRVSRSTKYS